LCTPSAAFGIRHAIQQKQQQQNHRNGNKITSLHHPSPFAFVSVRAARLPAAAQTEASKLVFNIQHTEILIKSNRVDDIDSKYQHKMIKFNLLSISVDDFSGVAVRLLVRSFAFNFKHKKVVPVNELRWSFLPNLPGRNSFVFHLLYANESLSPSSGYLFIVHEMKIKVNLLLH
jgi:hypothetical protein